MSLGQEAHGPDSPCEQDAGQETPAAEALQAEMPTEDPAAAHYVQLQEYCRDTQDGDDDTARVDRERVAEVALHGERRGARQAAAGAGVFAEQVPERADRTPDPEPGGRRTGHLGAGAQDQGGCRRDAGQQSAPPDGGGVRFVAADVAGGSVAA